MYVMCEDKINVCARQRQTSADNDKAYELKAKKRLQEPTSQERRSHTQLLLSLRVLPCCKELKSVKCSCSWLKEKTCWVSLWLPLHGACDLIGRKVRHIWKFHSAARSHKYRQTSLPLSSGSHSHSQWAVNTRLFYAQSHCLHWDLFLSHSTL